MSTVGSTIVDARVSVCVAAGLSLLVLAAGPAIAAGPDLRLVSAAADQDHDAVRELLDDGVDVNAARSDGVTALLWSVHWDDAAMVDLLVGAGANVNAAEAGVFDPYLGGPLPGLLRVATHQGHDIDSRSP